MTDWDQAVGEVISKTKKNKKTDRLDFIDFLVTHSNGPTPIDNIHEKVQSLGYLSKVGIFRDNRFINPVTKFIHGEQRRDVHDSWLHFDINHRTYKVHTGFAEAWRKQRGL
jgi:hypothetical protein